MANCLARAIYNTTRKQKHDYVQEHPRDTPAEPADEGFQSPLLNFTSTLPPRVLFFCTVDKPNPCFNGGCVVKQSQAVAYQHGFCMLNFSNINQKLARTAATCSSQRKGRLGKSCQVSQRVVLHNSFSISKHWRLPCSIEPNAVACRFCKGFTMFYWVGPRSLRPSVETSQTAGFFLRWLARCKGFPEKAARCGLF